MFPLTYALLNFAPQEKDNSEWWGLSHITFKLRKTYHFSHVGVQVESENNNWDQKKDQPHEGDLGEDQEQEEHNQSSSENNNDSTKGSQVARGQPRITLEFRR